MESSSQASPRNDGSENRLRTKVSQGANPLFMLTCCRCRGSFAVTHELFSHQASISDSTPAPIEKAQGMYSTPSPSLNGIHSQGCSPGLVKRGVRKTPAGGDPIQSEKGRKSCGDPEPRKAWWPAEGTHPTLPNESAPSHLTSKPLRCTNEQEEADHSREELHSHAQGTEENRSASNRIGKAAYNVDLALELVSHLPALFVQTQVQIPGSVQGCTQNLHSISGPFLGEKDTTKVQFSGIRYADLSNMEEISTGASNIPSGGAAHNALPLQDQPTRPRSVFALLDEACRREGTFAGMELRTCRKKSMQEAAYQGQGPFLRGTTTAVGHSDDKGSETGLSPLKKGAPSSPIRSSSAFADEGARSSPLSLITPDSGKLNNEDTDTSHNSIPSRRSSASTPSDVGSSFTKIGGSLGTESSTLTVDGKSSPFPFSGLSKKYTEELHWKLLRHVTHHGGTAALLQNHLYTASPPLSSSTSPPLEAISGQQELFPFLTPLCPHCWSGTVLPTMRANVCAILEDIRTIQRTCDNIGKVNTPRGLTRIQRDDANEIPGHNRPFSLNLDSIASSLSDPRTRLLFSTLMQEDAEGAREKNTLCGESYRTNPGHADREHGNQEAAPRPHLTVEVSQAGKHDLHINHSLGEAIETPTCLQLRAELQQTQERYALAQKEIKELEGVLSALNREDKLYQERSKQLAIRENKFQATQGILQDSVLSRAQELQYLRRSLAHLEATSIAILAFPIQVNEPIATIAGLRLGFVAIYPPRDLVHKDKSRGASRDHTSGEAPPRELAHQVMLWFQEGICRQHIYAQTLLSGFSSFSHKLYTPTTENAGSKQDACGVSGMGAFAPFEGASMRLSALEALPSSTPAGERPRVSVAEINIASGFLAQLLCHLAEAHEHVFRIARLHPYGERSTVDLLEPPPPAAARTTAPPADPPKVSRVLDFFVNERFFAWKTYGEACVVVAACVQELCEVVRCGLQCWRRRYQLDVRGATAAAGGPRGGRAPPSAEVGTEPSPGSATESRVGVGTEPCVGIADLLPGAPPPSVSGGPEGAVEPASEPSRGGERRTGTMCRWLDGLMNPPHIIRGDNVGGLSVRYGSVSDTIWTLGMRNLLENVQWCVEVGQKLVELNKTSLLGTPDA